MSKLIKDNWFILPTLILLSYIIIRFINQSQMIYTFPLDTTNDWSSYITQLHFLKICGFHNFCPYWYGGFTSFLIGAPGWPFFTYPLYALLGNIMLASYSSLVLIYLLAMLASFKIGSVLNFSKLRSLFFFAFYFGNSIAIGNFIRLGRVSEALTFMLGLWLIYFILKYKDKKLTPGFLLIIPIYAAIIITHYQEAFLLSLVPLCLLIYKRKFSERAIILLSLASAIILSLFWSYPFVIDALSPAGGSILSHIQSKWMLELNSAQALTTIASILTPLSFIIILAIRLLTSKKPIDLLRFYLPILLLSALFLLRINTLIPFLNNISSDPVTMFLLLFTLILILEMRGGPIFFKKIAIIAIIVLPLLSVTISHIHTPYFPNYTTMEYELLNVLEHTPTNFLVLLPDQRTSYANAYHCLGTIKFNLTTPAGWYPLISSREQLSKLVEINKAFKDKDCDTLVNLFKELNVQSTLSYSDYCERLQSCGFKIEYTNGQACLVSTQKTTQII